MSIYLRGTVANCAVSFLGGCGRRLREREPSPSCFANTERSERHPKPHRQCSIGYAYVVGAASEKSRRGQRTTFAKDGQGSLFAKATLAKVAQDGYAAAVNGRDGVALPLVLMAAATPAHDATRWRIARTLATTGFGRFGSATRVIASV